MRTALVCLLFSIAGFAQAGQSATAVCSPVFSKAVVKVMPGDIPMQAGYVSISNPCASAITITGVTSSAHKDTTLHSTVLVNGVSKMRAMPTLDLPPGKRIEMSPGGTHIMLMEPTQKLAAGGEITLQFKLADGRSVPVKFALKPY